MTDQLRAYYHESLQALYARAVRMADAIDAWMRYDAANAAPAAFALAKLSLAITSRVRDKAKALFDKVAAGSGLAPDDVASLEGQLSSASFIGAHVEQSTFKALHPVLSPTVNSILTELRIKGQVLVSCTYEATYELEFIDRSWFEKLVDGPVLDLANTPFLVFLIPRTPLEWPIHHILIFHEIGHAAYRTQAVAARFTITFPNSLRQPSIDENPRGHMEVGAQRDTYEEFLTHWVEELYSDAVGLLSCGGAFLSAFCKVVGGAGPLTTASEYHPPTALRISLMAKEAERRALLSAVPREAAPALRGAISAAAHYVDRGDYHVLEDADPVLRANLPDIVKEAERLYPSIVAEVTKLLGIHCYTEETQKVDTERAELIATLRIPAVEAEILPSFTSAGTPLSAARIFTRHWAAYYLDPKVRETKGELDHAKVMRHYGDGLLGSLDAAEALRAWRMASQ